MPSESHSRVCRGRLFASALFLCAVAGAVPPPTDFTMRSADGAALVSEDGTVTLAWAHPPLMSRVELQQSAEADFADYTIRFIGRDDGSVITGLPEGPHFFRLRSLNNLGEGSAWTEPLEVEVRFMDRGRLFSLLGLGGVVVLMTVGAIVSGFLNHRRDLQKENGGEV